MILVVKNNPGSVQNTVYLTPKEKRGAAWTFGQKVEYWRVVSSEVAMDWSDPSCLEWGPITVAEGCC